MGRYDITTGGREFAKWCGIADEPKNTPRFLRTMRRARRDAKAALDPVAAPVSEETPQ
jgi:hypothetical protein